MIVEPTQLLISYLPVIGPLSIDAGRVKTYVDARQNLLASQGIATRQLVYIDDVGQSMDLLGACIWMRYLELCGSPAQCPSFGLHGDYVFDFAATVHRRYGDQLHRQWPQENLTNSETQWLAQVRRVLGRDNLTLLSQIGSEAIVSDMQRELGEYGNECECVYASELQKNTASVPDLNATIERLQAIGWLLKRNDRFFLKSPLHDHEHLFQQGSVLSSLGLFIVFCDKFVRKEYTRTEWVLTDDCCTHARIIQHLLDAIHGFIGSPQPLSVSARVLAPVSVVEQGEVAQTSIYDEQAISFRELCQSHGQDRVKLQLLTTIPGPVEIRLHEYTEDLLQLIELKEKLEGVNDPRDEEPGTICESSFPDRDQQWQDLLAEREQAMAEATSQANPAILCQYVYRLAKFIKTYYNALLSQPAPDVRSRGLLLESKRVLVEVFNTLGIKSRIKSEP